jgi:hypothetical protein
MADTASDAASPPQRLPEEQPSGLCNVTAAGGSPASMSAYVDEAERFDDTNPTRFLGL